MPDFEDLMRILGKARGDIASTDGTATESLKLFTQMSNENAASKPRPDGLTKALAACLAVDPERPFESVVAWLHEHAEVPELGIETVDDEVVEWTDDKGRAQTTSIEALRKRVDRIRRSLSGR